MSADEGTQQRAGINWVQVIGAALAAVSSAVLLSTLGVAGTLIGAAMGSVIASVGGALYSRGIDASRHQVATQAAALRRVAQASARRDQAVGAVRRGEAGARTRLDQADRDLDEAQHELDEAGGAPDAPSDPRAATDDGTRVLSTGGPDATDAETSADDGSRWKNLPWRRIALVSALVFVIAMGAITAFELVSGHSVSSLTGGSDRNSGSTIPGLGSSKEKPATKPGEGASTGAESATPSDDASSSPGTSERSTTSATPTPTPTPTPTASLTPIPSVTPSEEGSAVP